MCLLLTGCISPDKAVPFLALRSAEERRKQYIDSIQYYIEKTDVCNIVYCDNSNAEADPLLFELAKQKNKNFEWLSFSGDTEKVVSYGKGYGEGEITQYALLHSVLLQRSESFIKITGKLYLLNLDLIVRLLSPKYSHLALRKNYVDTRCYFVKKADYEAYLLNAYHHVDDRNGYYLEHAFFDATKAYPHHFRPIPFAFRFQGISGSSGCIYADTKFKYLLNSTKTVLRSLYWHINKRIF